jgi:hypothetical protein
MREGEGKREGGWARVSEEGGEGGRGGRREGGREGKSDLLERLKDMRTPGTRLKI